MPHLKSLQLTAFRCMETADLRWDRQLSVFSGANGSGKTSLLEAIQWVLQKRSFRCRQPQRLIQAGADRALAILHIDAEDDSHRVGSEIRKDEVRWVWNENRDPSREALLTAFPVLLIEPTHITGLLTQPVMRRRWLDQATFHVEHSFVGAWQRYQRALQQRNAAFHSRGADPALWTEALATQADAVDALRREAFAQLQSAFTQVASALSAPWLESVQLEYRPGWDREIGLIEQLQQQQAAERRVGYTLAGAHRADIIIRSAQGLAREWLSRGQQKLLCICLQLALRRVVEEACGQSLLLWDDWQSELSPDTQAAALRLIRQSQGQVILTTPFPDPIAPDAMEMQLFHVKHGVWSMT